MTYGIPFIILRDYVLPCEHMQGHSRANIFHSALDRHCRGWASSSDKPEIKRLYYSVGNLDPWTFSDQKLIFGYFQLSLSSIRLFFNLPQRVERQDGNYKRYQDASYLQASLGVSPTFRSWFLACLGAVIFACLWWQMQGGYYGWRWWLYMVGAMLGLVIFAYGVSQVIDQSLQSVKGSANKFVQVALLLIPTHRRASVAQTDRYHLGKNTGRNT